MLQILKEPSLNYNFFVKWVNNYQKESVLRMILPEKLWINKIAQGDINIFSHFNIRGYVPFSRFCHLNQKWLLKSEKYYQIRIQQVRISRKRHLTCLYRAILILAPILDEKRKKSYARFSIKPEVTDRFCWFSIANTGHR